MPALPNLPTVFLVCCILNLLLSLGLLLVYATSSTYPGFRQWVIASFFVFFSCSLLSIRESLPLPPKLTTVLVNLTFFAYPLLLARGLRLFTGKPPKNWIAYLSLAAVGVIALYFLYLRPDSNIRVFLLSLLLVPLFADCGWLVRSVAGFAHPAVKGALIGAFGTMATWNLLRVPLGSVLPDLVGAPASGVLIQSTTLILLTCANTWISIGITLLNYARASESLRESEERFRNLASAAFEGIIISEGGRIIEANEQALRMLGYARADFVGRTISSLTALGSPSLVSNLLG
ncbi:MAG: PAS domain S-box protein, partial [Opitutus sp.]